MEIVVDFNQQPWIMFKLKSDRFGMEIIPSSDGSGSGPVLKSDHFGMEIKFLQSSHYLQLKS